MNRLLKDCLNDLESRIDVEQEERLVQKWIDFTDDRFEGVIFSPRRDSLSAPRCSWPTVPINSGLDDYHIAIVGIINRRLDSVEIRRGIVVDVYGPACKRTVSQKKANDQARQNPCPLHSSVLTTDSRWRIESSCSAPPWFSALLRCH